MTAVYYTNAKDSSYLILNIEKYKYNPLYLFRQLTKCTMSDL